MTPEEAEEAEELREKLREEIEILQVMESGVEESEFMLVTSEYCMFGSEGGCPIGPLLGAETIVFDTNVRFPLLVASNKEEALTYLRRKIEELERML